MANQKVLEAKAAEVQSVKEKIQKAQSVIIIDYKGLTVAQDTELRVAFRNAEVEYRVIKNSIASRAFSELGVTGLESVFQGTTAIAFGYKDPVSPAKIAKEHGDKFKVTSIKGGYMDGKVLSADEAKVLATIPTKEALISMLLYTITAPVRKLAVALDQIAKKSQ